MHRYDSLHLAMFSGKGGVGKTTLACGFARYWAQRFPQDQVLLLSTDPAHSLGDVLQVPVSDTAQPLPDAPNLQVRSLDAEKLLHVFKDRYGTVLELLVERGSFVAGEDLTPVWDLDWPGLDELMGILEIQQLLNQQQADRIVVDMAPSGHTLNLFELMDFLDGLLQALELFQQKHRNIEQTFTGRYTPDDADAFLQTMKTDLAAGRSLLQNQAHTACLVVAIAEPMSWLETQRFLAALQTLEIPCGGLWINRLLQLNPVTPASASDLDRNGEQQHLIQKFQTLSGTSHLPLWGVPLQASEPVGGAALDALMAQGFDLAAQTVDLSQPITVSWPQSLPPGFHDFVAAQQQLLLIGGKGGVGKTTVAAAIAWGFADRYPDRLIRVISIDPAHSLGDAFGQALGHQPTQLTANLSAQEVDADVVIEQFRDDYLWELAEMMSGESRDSESSLRLAYGPEAWRQIVSQSLPGIDEMLSLITVMDLLDRGEQDLIILDTAPTGHLLRFLAMPTALGDWLAWIFKLWIKYQDVLGRTDFMGRLRGLRQQVMQAQKKLKNPHHTEFIGVVQAQSAILAEAQRLTSTLAQMQVSQRYMVHNRYQPDQPDLRDYFPEQTIVRLPVLPRSVTPLERIQGAAQLLL
ncbi:arsenic transporter [Neosynechococcus sphagnicola sy1]|uniref:Arsenic transporter n=1 Tax=Neosynechococcus sphagnicola sy1 TaxID=1497020 RepID=A0A098TJC4_9CYAN|nr:ArsA family ATPase [Neosynechococcus sphagnicola]KGF72196.1 arsenic transporter [Neosynechococcus sphagnicola sy1]